MANRVVMDANGIRVSRPGVNVLTATGANLLMDSSRQMTQIIGSGSFTETAAGSRTVTVPNMGFAPFVIFGTNGAGTVYLTYNSNTSLTFNFTAALTWSYAVLNVPR